MQSNSYIQDKASRKCLPLCRFIFSKNNAVLQQFKVEPANPYYSKQHSFCADLTVAGNNYKGYGEFYRQLFTSSIAICFPYTFISWIYMNTCVFYLVYLFLICLARACVLSLFTYYMLVYTFANNIVSM